MISDAQARQKAQALVAQMTPAEMIAQLEYDAPAIPRLHLPAFNYWSEALHGVARAGTATVFPQAIGLSAMFDPATLAKIGAAVGTEVRAKHNDAVSHGDFGIYKGLTVWSPNVNIFRDPRWGRGHETYGEDPYLTAKNAVAYIHGLQGDGPYLRVAACAKHFAVHSGPEALRHEFDARPTPKDLTETYLPAFKAAVQEGHVESVMAAYNAVAGVPAPVNATLLTETLRQKWGFDGHVVSDFGAEEDVCATHHYTTSDAQSIAQALQAGCDLCAGHLAPALSQALAAGLVDQATITRAAERVLTTRMRLGLFAEDDPYAEIDYAENDTPAHHALALEAAAKSFVLLKNAGQLPLSLASLTSVAVVGPTADSTRVLEGNYNGTASNRTTILAGLRQVLPAGVRLNYAEGCHLFLDRTEPLAEPADRLVEAVSAAEHSDLTIACLGMDATIEGEQGDAGNAEAAGDRRDLALPGRQQQLLAQLLAVGKPVVLILTAGSAVTLGGLETHPNLTAILDVWYPGALGGQAVADVLLGRHCPTGKLPITFYQSTAELPAFTDYAMAKRTYRYMPQAALFPFGYGLTYGHMTLADAGVRWLTADREAAVAVQVHNPEPYPVTEVVQVYLRANHPDATPHPRLAAFQRVTVAPMQTQRVTLTVGADALCVVDAQGGTHLPDTDYDVYVGFGQPDARTAALTGQQALHVTLSK
ncbi:glycoside hydrolase family 3 protein [Lacticaseibacillus parakribbianus]|uniref:glycoside hydrolase family 3 protein n=1 Tax=Lacticaseibacillus parakribbianus TaxID=2970927 RepID=UPI0021CB9833|nr:glycoside hydrolase family 3 protein [Lacticaseibacillus parakribbianus]